MTESEHLYMRAEASDRHVLNFKATRLWFAALALVFVNYGLLTNVLGWTFYWQPAGDSAATTVVTAAHDFLRGNRFLPQTKQPSNPARIYSDLFRHSALPYQPAP